MLQNQNPPLYSVKGYKGAHLLLNVREIGIEGTPQGETNAPAIIADVQLIGSPTSFSAVYTDLQPFQMSEAMKEGETITLLAQEAVMIYGLEAKRVQRAADLARNPYNVQQAKRDELGETIKPSLNKLIVKGSKGWYIVTRGWCQCPDNTRGNTCKHRIAAWMHRESIVRPLAQARRVAPAVILAELAGQKIPASVA